MPTADQQAAAFKQELLRSTRDVERQMAQEWATAWKAIGERIDEATARIADDQAKLEELKRSLMGVRGDRRTEVEATIARLETSLPGLRAAVVRDQEWQDEIAVEIAQLSGQMAAWEEDAQQRLVELAQEHGVALGLAGWRDRANNLRYEVAAKTHGVMDVVWGPHKVGVPGKGEWAIAKKQGLYTTTANGQRLYAQERADAEELISYLKAGGEYGTPEFSRLLGYTEGEIQEYQAFLHAQKMAAVGSAVGWGRPSMKAIEHLVGRTMDGGILAKRFERLGEKTWAGMRSELVKGMALGQNPRTVARAMQVKFGRGLTENLVLARTEMIHSYRQASLMTYRENEDVVQGYRWCAELGPRTCQACISLHGTEFTLHNAERSIRKREQELSGEEREAVAGGMMTGGTAGMDAVPSSWAREGLEAASDANHNETPWEWFDRQKYAKQIELVDPVVLAGLRGGAVQKSQLFKRVDGKLVPRTLGEFSNSTRLKEIYAAEQQRRKEDPLWWRTRCDLGRANAVVGREMRFRTGQPFESAWSGETIVKMAGSYAGMKAWDCDIYISKSTADFERPDPPQRIGKYSIKGKPPKSREEKEAKYISVMIHELMHSYTKGTSPTAYSSNIDWEEGTVEAMMRVLRPTVVRDTGMGAHISDAAWRAKDKSNGYNRYIRGLEAIRKRQNVSRANFYGTLFSTRLPDRRWEAFKFDPGRVKALAAKRQESLDLIGVEAEKYDRRGNPTSRMFWGMEDLEDALAGEW
ncbi:MAG: hypothetical protein KAY24_00045 [Candidatus Eisenbacteria sp.]|nr:hypothetical protein [Candidatus Eisenbacteria bacterium]